MARAPTLVSVFDDEVRALVALPARGDAVRQTDRWAEQVTSRVATVVTAGSPVGGLASADRTLLEASQVLAALPPATRRPATRRPECAGWTTCTSAACSPCSRTTPG